MGIRNIGPVQIRLISTDTPTSLLPGERVSWSPVDDQSATLTDQGLTVACLTRFNEQNELVRCQSQRYSDETHRKTWVCFFSDYRDWQGLRVPTHAEATWVIDGEEKPAVLTGSGLCPVLA